MVVRAGSSDIFLYAVASLVSSSLDFLNMGIYYNLNTFVRLGEVFDDS